MKQSTLSTLGKKPGSLVATFIVLLCVLFAFAGADAFANEHAASAISQSAPGVAEAPAHHALPAAAPKLTEHTFINNSMIVTWVVAGLIIFFAQYATRKIRSSQQAALEVPNGAQNFWEFLVEGLRDFLEGIIGRDLAKKTFWFFATVFVFILFVNWFGLLPGVGTIGLGHYDAQGVFHLEKPILRGGNADLNMTFAMAMVFFVCWLYWAFSSNGVGGFFVHIFGNPARKEMAGFLKIAMAGIFIIVGLIEVISIMFRPVSLSFRLFGNVFAGENLLESMQNVVPALGWLTPLPFYFMELLVGLVQALVFMLLTAVFTLLICSHGDDHEHGDHAKEGGHH